MFTDTESRSLQVVETRLLTPLIREITFSPLDESPLPGFTAGAHIAVQVKLGSGLDWRRYSLVNADPAQSTSAHTDKYVIAVRLEETGLGGSRYMHESVNKGDIIRVQLPRNDFELDPDAEEVVLLGGGIGITPLLTMAAQCRAQGRPVRLVYVGRERNNMAYQELLSGLLGSDLVVHCDDEHGGPIDLLALMKASSPAATFHVCGPQGLLDAVLNNSKTLGWPESRVRFELFSPPAAQEGDQSFEIVLNSSGQTLLVPPDKSILQVLEEAGHDPLFDCRRGECGVCACPVLDGEIDHRDYVLSKREQDAGNTIVTCVSRAKSERLTLDM